MNHGDVVTNEMNTASQQVAELAFRHPERNDSVDSKLQPVARRFVGKSRIRTSDFEQIVIGFRTPLHESSILVFSPLKPWPEAMKSRSNRSGSSALTISSHLPDTKYSRT
jgi:hypothetical protein